MTPAHVRVRPSFYRCGRYCIHKGHRGWSVYEGPAFVQTFRVLACALRFAGASR